MVYKRQLFFQYSRPSGCDTSKLLSDDLKNKLYYDGFQKMLYHYSHQKKQTHVCVSAFLFVGAAGFEQDGGIIVLQVRVTDRFGEEAGAAAKDEMRGVRNVCDGVALREVRQEGILIKAAELGDGFQQGILCNGMGIPVENALVQLVQRVGAAVQAGGVAVEFGGRDPGKLFDRLALNGGKLGRGCGT